MSGPTLDVQSLISPDILASDIANKWHEWDNYRSGWKDEKVELRNYIYATDTRTTTNSKLPWSNSTTTPKLTQIYDNLKANYTAALFPKNKWMKWEADSSDGLDREKANVIQAYMENKLRQSKFTLTMDKLIDDFILYGNCFASVEFERDYVVDTDTGLTTTKYLGPKLVRVSPYDIVFNPIASDFTETPKIIRSLKSLGELKSEIAEGDTYFSAVFDRILTNRREVSGQTSTEKSEGFIADGFSSLQNYYNSGYIELLTYFGDIYDPTSGTLKKNRKVIVVDRAYVIYDEEIDSWLGEAPIHHAGWRNRQDNLYAMGPLDNLVGMQYRIDHLENLKADVFDLIAYPIQVIYGDVEDYKYEPGSKIYVGEEGRVEHLRPDATALQADMQINVLESKMEELAGAPKQAMGIRTPGEKTAFEVQTLQNSAGRIFQHKAAKLEAEFIEPILNTMLEAARRSMTSREEIRIFDDPTGAFLFQEITREDIVSKGKIVPIGARHFAERAQKVQDLNSLLQIRASDPSIAVHISGKALAKRLTEEVGEPDAFGENIGVTEQMETQEAASDAEADVMENQQMKMEQGL